MGNQSGVASGARPWSVYHAELARLGLHELATATREYHATLARHRALDRGTEHDEFRDRDEKERRYRETLPHHRRREAAIDALTKLALAMLEESERPA